MRTKQTARQRLATSKGGYKKPRKRGKLYFTSKKKKPTEMSKKYHEALREFLDCEDRIALMEAPDVWSEVDEKEPVVDEDDEEVVHMGG